jgi:hypothetical protein
VYDILVDYQFLSNCISIQMRMTGRLGENQFLIVEDVELDEDDNLLNLSCTMIEEPIN